MSITLPATANCGSAGAICTSDGRPLSNSNSASVIGPVGISVADARVEEDYTAASGTLSFQAGESSATIEVAVLDDAHDEGEETLTLRLSNASGAVVTDGEATGTIENADLMPAALLARFGRATAEQVVTHIEERMAAPRRRGFRARLAGRELQPGQRAGRGHPHRGADGGAPAAGLPGAARGPGAAAGAASGTSRSAS